MTLNAARVGTLAAWLVLSTGANAAVSTFDSTADGWTALGDAAGPLTWSATGGNPGGHAFINDAVVGGVTYFLAPSSFLGNQAGALGTSLTFDLQQTYPGAANQFDAADVILQGNGLTVAYDLAVNPALNAWTSYAVPLVATGWALNDLGGAAVTNDQFASILANLTSLRIRAEFQTGSDLGRLDNVALVPEPGTTALMLGGLAVLAGALGGRRRRSGSA